ncbi:MAG: sulfatase [Deltaproteobacteria bacterium]|nr:sulfatase [Deltaproteobacteria bacterium]
MKKLAIVLAVVVLVLGVLVAREYLLPAKALKHPHIVLIVIDTLRADHVSAYGYTRQTTPTLDLLASRRLLFENAHAPTSWTLPSMATLFTGLPPRTHGIVEGLQFMGQIVSQHQMSEEFDTLAERLFAAGYETFGYSTNAHVTRQTGFAQASPSSRRPPSPTPRPSKNWSTKTATVSPNATAKASPTFLYMQLFDPHVPYMVREPFAKQLAPDFDFDAFLNVNAEHGDLMIGLPPDYFDTRPGQLQALRDAYDSEVAATDDVIGRILAELPGADDALILMVSDHGEAFYEHKTMLHGFDLFEETVRVPMILRPPVTGKPFAAARKTDPVFLEDVVPTLLSAAGATHADLAGVDIRGAVPKDRAHAFHLKRGPMEQHGAMIWPEKLIVDRYGMQRFYFNLEDDPGETKNLIDAATPPEKLVTAAEQAWTIEPKVRPIMIHNDQVTMADQLRSLGYLSPGKSPTADASPSPTPEKTPWYIELGVCPKIKAIVNECGQNAACVDPKIEALKEDTCPKAESFNFRKKCEFFRVPQTLTRCDSFSTP